MIFVAALVVNYSNTEYQYNMFKSLYCYIILYILCCGGYVKEMRGGGGNYDFLRNRTEGTGSLHSVFKKVACFDG